MVLEFRGANNLARRCVIILTGRMAKEFITAGYLDVKISAKVKRGFTPWKVSLNLTLAVWRLVNLRFSRRRGRNNGVK